MHRFVFVKCSTLAEFKDGQKDLVTGLGSGKTSWFIHTLQVLEGYMFLGDPEEQPRDLALAFTRIMNESILQKSKELLVTTGALGSKPCANVKTLKDTVNLLPPQTFPLLLQRVSDQTRLHCYMLLPLDVLPSLQ